MNREALETMSAAGSKATVFGASMTGWGWIVSNEFFGLMGVVIALAGLATNLYYKWRADRRLEAEAAQRATERQLRMELMRVTHVPIPPPADSDLAKLEPTE